MDICEQHRQKKRAERCATAFQQGQRAAAASGEMQRFNEIFAAAPL